MLKQSLHVVGFDSAAEFLAVVEEPLLEHEGLNSLLLGILRAQRRQSQTRRRFRPLYAAVLDGERPVLVAVATSPHKVLLGGDGDPSQVTSPLVQHLRDHQSRVPAVFGLAALSSAFAESWTAANGIQALPGLTQTLYHLDSVVRPAWLPVGRHRLATYHDRDLLAEWVHAFQTEALPSEAEDFHTAQLVTERLIADEQLVVWQGEEDRRGRPLSMAAKARPLDKGVSINLVYTPPELRGFGYASACVAALSQQLLDDGWRFVTLFTDRTNATSNHIYQEIGYRPVADFDEFRFVPA